MEMLKYVSTAVLQELREKVTENLDRYRSGDFEDLAGSYGWGAELRNLKVDLEPIRNLNPEGGPEAEVENSLAVWNSLHDLRPSLACEDRIWTRLTHVEGFGFARSRWLGQDDDDKLCKAVKDHFFAGSLTRWRDDNAISRLWWNAFIAKLADPDNLERALRLMLKRADHRSNIVERSSIASRPKLASAIVRAMLRIDWITAHEKNFREFMKAVNLYGGGVFFELMTDSELDEFMDKCYRSAEEKGIAKAA